MKRMEKGWMKGNQLTRRNAAVLSVADCLSCVSLRQRAEEERQKEIQMKEKELMERDHSIVWSTAENFNADDPLLLRIEAVRTWPYADYM